MDMTTIALMVGFHLHAPLPISLYAWNLLVCSYLTNLYSFLFLVEVRIICSSYSFDVVSLFHLS
jgi:hypothetical protein